MDVSKESRTISFSASEVAQAAGLPNPDQYAFADGQPLATVTLERSE